MPTTPSTGFGAEADRIERGELASSTEARLRELVGWGGSTSFFSPAALAVGSDVGIHPVGQVVGLATGLILRGYVRTTHGGQGRMRPGVARWLEYTGPNKSWTLLRQHALGRLTKQATLLQAHAVIGIEAARSADRDLQDGFGEAYVRFTGTAVRIDGWKRASERPVLTLASAQEIWSMFHGGIEPVGVAGGFAQVETLPSQTTISVGGRGYGRTSNMELEEPTKAVYEARRLALDRLVADAKALNSEGLLGIDLHLENPGSGHARLPPLTLTVHVLATAIRRVNPKPFHPMPALYLSRRRNA